MSEEKQEEMPLLRQLLLDTKLEALCGKDTQVLEIRSDETPIQAFEKIVARGVLSAPVWDVKEKKYVGILDTRDLVAFVVFLATEREAEEAAAQTKPSPSSSSTDPANAVQSSPRKNHLRSIFDAAAKMYDRPVQGVTVSYLARRNKAHEFNKSDSLSKAVATLANRVHRVLIMEGGKCVEVLSQSTVVAFLNKQMQSTPALANEFAAVTVKESDIGTTPVLVVNTKSSALDTFKVMNKYNLSGIAVVDESGRFVGNTSGSDLKLFMKKPSLMLLRQPVLEFLAAVRRAVITEKTRSPTISVASHDTVAKVIGKLAATRIHRVFVCEESKGYQPQAVISISDLLKLFVARTH